MVTLKINELSVGDWVQDKNGIYAKVIGIENWSDGYFLNIELHGVNVGVTPLASVHPIPITAEILEGNGFGKKTFTQDQLFRIVEPNGNMPFIGYRWDSRRVIIERDNDYMLRVKAEYIHELQHALRLAGVDKEINL